MYSIRSIFEKSPIEISGGVIVIVNAAISAGFIDWSKASVAFLNIVLVTLLGLFVRKTTVNASKLNDLHDETLKAIKFGRDEAHAEHVRPTRPAKKVSTPKKAARRR